MKRIYLPHKAVVVTDKDWGQTYASNVESLVRAAGVCQLKKESIKKNPIGFIDRYVWNQKHYALLEHTNVEYDSSATGRVDKDSSICALRNWRREFCCTQDDAWEHIRLLRNGSWRDMWELWDRKPEEYGRFLRVNHLKIPYNNPCKRLQILVRTNADTGHKLRTHRAISQLSLSPTAQKGFDWGKVLPIVCWNLPNMESWFDRKFMYCQKDYNAHTYLVENSTDEEEIDFWKITAKRSLPPERINLRVMTGRIKDFQDLLKKRRKSPRHKRDVFAVVDAIEKAIVDWIKNKGQLKEKVSLVDFIGIT